MDRHQNYIAGDWAPPKSGNYYQTRNPASPEHVLGEFPCSGPADVELALDTGEAARKSWADTPAPQRAAILLRFSQLLVEERDELARIITLEQGKALSEARGEVTRAASEASFA